MATVEERIERLKKVKKLILRKATRKEMAKQLHVSENTITSDIKLIRSQIIEILKKDTIETLLVKIELEFEEIQEGLRNLSQSKHPNIKLGAYNSRGKNLQLYLDMLKTLGVFEYVEKHSVEIKTDLNEFKNWLAERAEKEKPSKKKKGK